MKIQKNIDIYLLKKHQKRTIEAVQYDTGVQLVFSILDFDLPEGCTATIYVRKKSGSCVYQECGVVVEDNTVIVDLNNQALTETGECAYQIRLMKDDNIVSTFAGTMWVAPSLADVDAVESKTVLSALDNVIAESTEKIISEKSDELLASRANAIVCDKEGDAVSVSDSSESPIQGLTVYGKTTQNGIPTPQAPIELVNAGNSGTIKVTVSDGKEQSQSVSVGIPSNLCGIPVASGGNYTDENGQAWICDELDLENGVYIKRTEKKSFTLTKQVYATSPLGYRYTAFATLGSDFCLCEQLPYNANAATHLATTDGIRCAAQYGTIAAQYTDTAGDTQTLAVDVLYVLATPIETPLTIEQTEAIKALYTYYPSTIVTNNGGAGMKIKYTADTKLYVDKKFAELSAAILGE